MINTENIQEVVQLDNVVFAEVDNRFYNSKYYGREVFLTEFIETSFGKWYHASNLDKEKFQVWFKESELMIIEV